MRRDWFLRMNLRPRHLQLLVTLDELRHVGKAALLLNVTQPAVSKSLSEIQAELGMTLFKRTSRGIEPTELGSCIVRHARAILEEFSRAGDELNSLSHGVTGRVAVGAPPSASLVVLPRSVALFKERSPQTRVLIEEGASEDLIARLRAGSLDLIVGMLTPRQGLVDIESVVLYEEAMVLAAGCAHPLAKKKRPAWSDLDGQPWVLPPMSLLLRVFVEDILRSHGLTIPHNYVESVSVEAYVGLMQTIGAVAIIPRRVAQHFEATGQIRILPLALPDVRGPVSVAWLRNKPPSPAAQTMIDCMRAVDVG